MLRRSNNAFYSGYCKENKSIKETFYQNFNKAATLTQFSWDLHEVTDRFSTGVPENLK